MACFCRLHVLSNKIGYHLGLFHHSRVTKRYINVRNLSVTACHGKTYSGTRKSYTESESEKDSENDLDFFGITGSDKGSTKFKKLSDSDKNYIDELVERHAVAKGPKNLQLKSYGSIRYDQKIPDLASEVQQSEQKSKPKQTRQERRLNKAAQRKKADASASSHILLSENDVDITNNDKTEGNVKIKNTGSYNSRNSLHEYKEIMKDNNVALSKSKDLTHSDKGLSIIDEQFFSYEQNVERNVESDKSLKEESQNVKVKESNRSFKSVNDLPFIDDQYFIYDYSPKNDEERVTNSENIENLDERPVFRREASAKLQIPKLGKSYETIEIRERNKGKDEKEELSFVDEQYFSVSGSREETQYENEMSLNPEQIAGHRKERKYQKEEIFPSDQNREERDSKFKDRSSYEDKRRRKDKPKVKADVDQTEKGEDETPLAEKKLSAYDASIKVRAEFERKRGSNLIGKFNPKQYDSKGFRILADQVPHFENSPSIDVLKVLRKSIIYDRNDIVAITKPYGLPSHDGPGVFHSVGSLLDRLIPRTQLFPVHRLDKETTGVMLFAKTEEMANLLSERFLSRNIKKKYLVITKNIPEMQSGEIDIPITEGTVEGKVRMCLRPYNSPELSAITKKRQPGTEAITRYRVLDQGKKCALLECFPVTGKKHQIRAHLALGLNCPVLGDHKYSHIDRIAPMKLHPEILKYLKIQQSKVRYLAMHLHARSIMIPEFLDGRNLFISAPLPPHFLQNMRDLKLRLPPHS